MKKVLSNFSKAIRQSRALSFGLSAKRLCDSRCQMLKRNLCYAESPERLYKDYYRKLVRHQRMAPHNLIERAIDELPKNGLKWFRFSVSGSVPPRAQVKDWGKFTSSLKRICSMLKDSGVKVHFPIESKDKATLYRSVLGDLVTIRRTIQNHRELKNFTDAAAYVCGVTRGPHNLALSQQLADEVRESGKTAVVCPAVFKNKHGSKSKCGQCTACSSSDVDLVIYPLH